MAQCVICGRQSPLIASSLGLCVECIRRHPAQALPLAADVHHRSPREFGLPEAPPPRVTPPQGRPDSADGGTSHSTPGRCCHLCVNECSMAEGETGYCGLRYNEGGTLKHLAATPKRPLLRHTLRDYATYV